MNTSHNLDIGKSQLQLPQDRTIEEFQQNVELTVKSPFSSTGSLVMSTTSSTISIKSENDKETQYPENRKSSHRGKEVFSDNESSSSTFYNFQTPRRRTLSSTSRHQERFSLNDLDSVSDLTLRRNLSLAKNKGASNNGLVRSNSFEQRDKYFDRVRIGNAGKGFSSLIIEEGSKGNTCLNFIFYHGYIVYIYIRDFGL